MFVTSGTDKYCHHDLYSTELKEDNPKQFILLPVGNLSSRLITSGVEEMSLYLRISPVILADVHKICSNRFNEKSRPGQQILYL
jgi:hypothetical protein